jgi:hypothetical protein
VPGVKQEVHKEAEFFETNGHQHALVPGPGVQRVLEAVGKVVQGEYGDTVVPEEAEVLGPAVGRRHHKETVLPLFQKPPQLHRKHAEIDVVEERSALAAGNCAGAPEVPNALQRLQHQRRVYRVNARK